MPVEISKPNISERLIKPSLPQKDILALVSSGTVKIDVSKIGLDVLSRQDRGSQRLDYAKYRRRRSRGSRSRRCGHPGCRSRGRHCSVMKL